jgi:hypothetical protein
VSNKKWLLKLSSLVFFSTFLAFFYTFLIAKPYHLIFESSLTSMLQLKGNHQRCKDYNKTTCNPIPQYFHPKTNAYEYCKNPYFKNQSKIK